VSPTSQIDAAIAAVAATQVGNIKREQLLRLGMSRSQIAHRIRLGRLHPLHRGVYSVGYPPTDPLQWAAAAVLACGPRAMLSHHSAMTLWGLWQRWDRPFELTLAGDRRPKGFRTHRVRNLLRRDVGTERGIRVTSPARTLIDMAPCLTRKSLTRAVNNARHKQILTLGDLADVAARFPYLPGAKLLSAFETTRGGPTRSGWEDDFPAFCKRHGLPEPIMSAVVAGHEVDALFPAEKVIVELDSWDFHWSRQSFEDDRNRDMDTAAADHQTVRMTAERLERSEQYEADRLDQILRNRRR
jgi:hypothetical protein